jgi:hypothetical protein
MGRACGEAGLRGLGVWPHLRDPVKAEGGAYADVGAVLRGPAARRDVAASEVMPTEPGTPLADLGLAGGWGGGRGRCAGGDGDEERAWSGLREGCVSYACVRAPDVTRMRGMCVRVYVWLHQRGTWRP